MTERDSDIGDTVNTFGVTLDIPTTLELLDAALALTRAKISALEEGDGTGTTSVGEFSADVTLSKRGLFTFIKVPEESLSLVTTTNFGGRAGATGAITISVLTYLELLIRGVK